MNILILNPILFTPEHNIIPKVKSIKDTMIYNMCLGFIKLGHNITLAAAKEYHPTESGTYEFNVIFFPSRYTKFCPPSVLPYSPSLKKYLRQNHKKFDLIISSEVFSFNSLFAAEICPKKTIIWHELALHPSKFHKVPSKLWYNCICPLFMKNVKCIIPRSEASRNFIKKYFCQVSNQCVEHGINIEKFKYSNEKKNEFTFVGQLIPRKNINNIILKFSRFLKLSKESFTLLIVGRGFLAEELKKYAEQLGISDNVKFIGFVNHYELNNLLKKSLALLIDTLQDNNMVSIPESIVSGTPILTNNIPTNSPMILKNQLGIAKQNWDENDMLEIFNNNSFYVNNCIQYREKLTNQHSAQLLIEIFNSYQNNKIK